MLYVRFFFSLGLDRNSVVLSVFHHEGTFSEDKLTDSCCNGTDLSICRSSPVINNANFPIKIEANECSTTNSNLPSSSLFPNQPSNESLLLVCLIGLIKYIYFFLLSSSHSSYVFVMLTISFLF